MYLRNQFLKTTYCQPQLPQTRELAGKNNCIKDRHLELQVGHVILALQTHARRRLAIGLAPVHPGKKPDTTFLKLQNPDPNVHIPDGASQGSQGVKFALISTSLNRLGVPFPQMRTISANDVAS